MNQPVQTKDGCYGIRVSDKSWNATTWTHDASYYKSRPASFHLNSAFNSKTISLNLKEAVRLRAALNKFLTK